MTSLIMIDYIGTIPGKHLQIAEKSIPHTHRNARQGIANPCQLNFLTQKIPTTGFDFSTFSTDRHGILPKKFSFITISPFSEIASFAKRCYIN